MLRIGLASIPLFEYAYGAGCGAEDLYLSCAQACYHTPTSSPSLFLQFNCPFSTSTTYSIGGPKSLARHWTVEFCRRGLKLWLSGTS